MKARARFLFELVIVVVAPAAAMFALASLTHCALTYEPSSNCEDRLPPVGNEHYDAALAECRELKGED